MHILAPSVSEGILNTPAGRDWRFEVPSLTLGVRIASQPS
jgi:hypothetical protein